MTPFNSNHDSTKIDNAIEGLNVNAINSNEKYHSVS
jgi:hypothetical protein